MELRFFFLSRMFEFVKWKLGKWLFGWMKICGSLSAILYDQVYGCWKIWYRRLKVFLYKSPLWISILHREEFLGCCARLAIVTWHGRDLRGTQIPGFKGSLSGDLLFLCGLSLFMRLTFWQARICSLSVISAFFFFCSGMDKGWIFYK